MIHVPDFCAACPAPGANLVESGLFDIRSVSLLKPKSTIRAGFERAIHSYTRSATPSLQIAALKRGFLI